MAPRRVLRSVALDAVRGSASAAIDAAITASERVVITSVSRSGASWACARVRIARWDASTNAMDDASNETSPSPLSTRDASVALEEVEYASEGWETGDASASVGMGTMGGGRWGGTAATATARRRDDDDDDDDDDGAGMEGDVTASESDYVGGTQGVNGWAEDGDDFAATQTEDAREGRTRVVEDDDAGVEEVDEASGWGGRALLRIAPSKVTTPGERARDGSRDGRGDARATSPRSTAARSPPEARARRARETGDGDANDVDTEPTAGIAEETPRDDVSKRVVECTPADAAAEPLREPPALKRPGVLAGRAVDSSGVTESARPIGSIGSDPVENFGVARTAIDAMQRAKARRNAPVGVDASMPQHEECTQPENEDIIEATPAATDAIEEDFISRGAVEDDGDGDRGEFSPPSSPDIGMFYSQRHLDEEDDVENQPQTQQSQSPFKKPLTLTQPEVESPRSRIMLSQHQWRQPRRRAPPPPRFEEETPPKRMRIIDDDLSQSMTQPTQGEPSQGGDFVERTQQENEGGVLRSRITSIPASVVSRGVASSGLRLTAISPTNAAIAVTPSKDEVVRPLPTLGCPKCRYSRGGCGRCRLILENAKKGIWPKRRGRPSTGTSVASASAARAVTRVTTKSATKTPSSKTPTSKTPASVRSKRARDTKKATVKRSEKLFASLHFLLSGLDKPQGSATKELIREHGGFLLTAPSSDVSVNSVIVITPKMGRTMKCLYGVAAGTRFATPSWVEACVEARELIHLDEPLDDNGRPRAKHRSSAGKLFRDVKTAITGNDAFVKDFTSLLRHAGATLEPNPQTAERFDYLIIQSGEKPHSAWIRASKRLDVPCVRHEWLVESILAGELLNSDSFAVDASAAPPPPPRFSINPERRKVAL